VRIGVVGCGTAGAAAALLLAERGHSVELLERVTDPAPVGAGLLLQPTGLAVLDHLGLRDPIVASGARVERLRGETARGRMVMDLRYDVAAPGLFGLGVHRGALFSALAGALPARGVALRSGTGVVGVERGGDLPVLRDAQGRRHGPYELVVAADGARSTLRSATGLCRSDRRYPWGALWTILDDPDGRFDGALAQVYRGTTEMIGFLPTGVRPSGAGGSGRRQVSLFWSVRCSEGERWPDPGLDALKRAMRGLTAKVDPLLDQLCDPGQVLFAPYRDVRMPGRWHEGRLVLIGDAGHAMSPQLGQGANLALLDAWTLARCLDEHAGVHAALARYSARRRAHLRFYAIASRRLTPLFQADHEALAAPRDLLLVPAGRIPWLGHQMIATLAGAKTGPFSTLGPAELPAIGHATGAAPPGSDAARSTDSPSDPAGAARRAVGRAPADRGR
jgi:2-polyprenyl-6-methoxyphenol hydroxylase-like FAD-dependent oxidoreductase